MQILSAAFGTDIDGKEPFDIEGCDWTTDRGKVIGISTLLCFVLMIVPSIFVVREGASKVYDRVWDFALTIVLLHIILSCAIGGAPANGQWWGTLIGGVSILIVGGWKASETYYGMQAQERLNSKVDALN